MGGLSLCGNWEEGQAMREDEVELVLFKESLFQ